MIRRFRHLILENRFSAKNWESDIRKVFIEPCDEAEAPLGYRAVFYLKQAAAHVKNQSHFAIGASFLSDRINNLSKAGYVAPMTRRAITLVERQMGQAISI